ncbi:radical SAM protein [Candidatus Woesearchaeota archaeon]|nr:radical SAM protein [Candidatus Woesearchaeota archaeon]
MGEIAYSYKENLYINLTNRCTNECVFCDIDILGNVVGSDLKIEKEPTSEEVISKLEEKIKNNNPNEIVFCGVGDPLLRLKTLLEVTSHLKKNYLYPIRLDTNGHTYRLYPNKEVVAELKMRGIGTAYVSMNATTKEVYESICKPTLPDAFEETINFIKKCKAADIKTKISFVSRFVNVTECEDFAKELGVEYFIRNFIPRTNSVL